MLVFNLNKKSAWHGLIFIQLWCASMEIKHTHFLFFGFSCEKSSPHEKKINGAEKTVDHNRYCKLYAQQGQTAQKVSMRKEISSKKSVMIY